MTSHTNFALRFWHECDITPALMPLVATLCGMAPILFFDSSLGVLVIFFVFLQLLLWGRLLAREAVPFHSLPRTLLRRYHAYCSLSYALFVLLAATIAQIHLCGVFSSYLRKIPRAECATLCRVRISGNPPPAPLGTTVRVHADLVAMMQPDGDWTPCGGRVLLTFERDFHAWTQTLTPLAQNAAQSIPCRLRHGDLLQISGALLRPDSADPRARHYQRHLLSLGIRHILTVRSCEQVPVRHSFFQRLLRTFYALRDHACTRLTAGMRPLSGGLYQAMVFGRRDAFPTDVREEFLRSSTIHIFAISGLHVGVVFGIFWLTLAIFGCHLRWRGILAASGCIAYAVLTGLQPSSTRACTMIALLCLPALLSRGRNARNALCTAALALLWWNPLQLYHSGFLFSFTVVAGLLYGQKLASALTTTVAEPHAWLAQSHLRYKRTRRCKQLVQAVTTACFAWLTCTPLALCMNGLLPLASLFFNVITTTLAEGLVLCAVPKLALSWLAPRLSCLMGRYVLDPLMAFLVTLAQQSASGWGFLRCAAPSGLSTTIVVFTVFALIIGYRNILLRRTCAALILLWYAWVIAAPSQSVPATWICHGGTAGDIAIASIHQRHAPVSITLFNQTRHAARQLAYALKEQGYDSCDVVLGPSRAAERRAMQDVCQLLDVQSVCIQPDKRLTPTARKSLGEITAHGIHWSVHEKKEDASLCAVTPEGHTVVVVRDGHFQRACVFPHSSCAVIRD